MPESKREYRIDAEPRRTKDDCIALVEECLAASPTPGATAESIDEALREGRATALIRQISFNVS